VKYPKVKLKDIAEIKGGKRLPKGETLVDYETEHPYIRGQDIKGGIITFDEPKYISKEVYEKIKRYTVDKGDVCVTIVANIGDVGIVPPFLDGANLTENAVKLVDYKRSCNPFYLKYSLLTNEAKSTMVSFAAGAAQSKLGIYKLQEIEVPFPGVTIQNKIASLLSAYDNLIENNNRRIKILEEIAQTIYDEWFVKFRFPGHSKVKIVDSELGKVPEGWEVRLLSDIVETQYGYTETASGEEIGPKFVRGKDINKSSYIDWRSVPYCKIDNDEHPKYKLSKWDIVVIRMADPGKVGIIEKDINAVFASYLVRLKETHNLLTTYYLFYSLLSDRYQSYISGASTGTTRKSASAGVLTGIKICIPPRRLLDMFEAQVEPLRNLLNNLVEKNSLLYSTRDILLPKFISGEIDVEDLDIDVGDIDDR